MLDSQALHSFEVEVLERALRFTVIAMREFVFSYLITSGYPSAAVRLGQAALCHVQPDGGLAVVGEEVN